MIPELKVHEDGILDVVENLPMPASDKTQYELALHQIFVSLNTYFQKQNWNGVVYEFARIRALCEKLINVLETPASEPLVKSLEKYRHALISVLEKSKAPPEVFEEISKIKVEVK
jgi:hypothetical protein